MTISRLKILDPLVFFAYDRGVAYKSDGLYRLHWNTNQMNTTKSLSPHVRYLFAFVLNLDLKGAMDESGVCIYPTRTDQ